MGWFRDRVSLLWGASAHKKMLLTLAAGAFIFLGSLDQLKILAQKASSAWIKFPQNTGESIMIFGFPSWIIGAAVGFFFLFLWMLEVAWHYKKITIPNFNLSFDKNGMGIVLAEHPNLKPGPTLGTTQETKEKGVYVRIRVDALSKTTIKGCFAFIIALEKQPKGTTAFTPIALPQPVPLKGQQFDIIPEVPCMLDFLMSGEWDNRLVSTTYWPFILSNIFKDEATYRFTFVVNGDGVSKTKQVAPVSSVFLAPQHRAMAAPKMSGLFRLLYRNSNSAT